MAEVGRRMLSGALRTECCDWGCRCSERLLLGDAFISTAGAGDLELANLVAREMVYKCGFSRRLGPVALMDSQTGFLRGHGSETMADIGTELAAIALTDIKDVRCSGRLTNTHLSCKLPRHGAAVLCVQLQRRSLALVLVPGSQIAALTPSSTAVRISPVSHARTRFKQFCSCSW